MRLALLSDIHSNLQALEAVLDAVDDRGVDEMYCLGDIVGYGADPLACLDLVRKRCSGIVMGNHDQAVVSEPHRTHLPRDGKKAARHNHDALSEYDLASLAALPLRIDRHGFTFVHATPDQPEHWFRLSTIQAVQAQFEAFDGDVCFVGHTHRPAIMADRLGVSQVRRGHRFLINVGSVGQPRDGDPRACVGFFDTETFDFELDRVTYDVETAMTRIRTERLPKSLADRLTMGI